MEQSKNKQREKHRQITRKQMCRHRIHRIPGEKMKLNTQKRKERTNFEWLPISLVVGRYDEPAELHPAVAPGAERRQHPAGDAVVAVIPREIALKLPRPRHAHDRDVKPRHKPHLLPPQIPHFSLDFNQKNPRLFSPLFPLVFGPWRKGGGEKEPGV